MELRVALLNAAHDPEGNRRNFRRELSADLVEYHVADGDVPETVDFDAAVVTGSRASAYWDEPWIDDLTAWIREADAADVPLLGVCFGHQAIARALGGSVEPMDDYEIGYRTVRHDGEGPLLAGVDEEFTAFTTHSDRVTELPPGAEQFAENDYGVHGFRRENAFTVQFHPEYDRESAIEVTEDKRDQLPQDRIEAVLGDVTAENVDAACEPKQLFENFIAHVRTQQAAATADD